MTPIGVYQYSYLPLSETFIYRQLLGLRKRFDLRLFSLMEENVSLFPGFSTSLIPKKSLLERISGKYKTTTFTPKRERFIVDLLKDVKMLYVNFGHMALSMQPMAAEAGVPIAVFFHGVDASAFLKDPNYVGEYAKAKFHTVFTNSENMKQRLAPFLPPATLFRVVRYGVDPDVFRFRQRNSVPKGAKFLQISRLDHKKGIGVTLEVMARYFREVDRSARLVIAGDGPLRNPLAARTQQLGIAEFVTFLGKVDQARVVDLLQTSDVLLQHSVVAPDGDMEGVPNVLIEAMACGVPVVSTYHSGIPELVEHGVNGLLVNEHDREGYYRELVSLSTMDVGSMSLNARRTVEERFDSSKNNELLCNYVQEVCDGVVTSSPS